MIPVSFVTPSTSPATGSPNWSLTSIEAGARVLDGVVEQRRAERLGVEPQPGADLRHLDRVDDELLARPPALVGVALAGEREGPLDRLAVEPVVAVRRVLADHREQVAEQRPLVGREALGDSIDRGGGAVRFLGADLDVTAAVGRDGCALDVL